MIGRGFAEGQTQEFLEGQPVIDLIFKFWNGGDIHPVEFNEHSTGAKPFLQQQAFEQQDGRIRLGAFLAGALPC